MGKHFDKDGQLLFEGIFEAGQRVTTVPYRAFLKWENGETYFGDMLGDAMCGQVGALTLSIIIVMSRKTTSAFTTLTHSLSSPFSSSSSSHNLITAGGIQLYEP